MRRELHMALMGGKKMTPASKWLAMPSIRVFDEVECSKGQAMKVLEEAAEVLEAWKAYEDQQNDYWRNSDVMDDLGVRLSEKSLLDECADVIQATCNLLAAIGVEDMSDAMRECEMRNRARGRC